MTDPRRKKNSGLHTEAAAEAAYQHDDDTIIILSEEDAAPTIELAEAVGRPPAPADIATTPQLEDALDTLFDGDNPPD